MMDIELLHYLEGMEARINARIDDVMARMNDQHELLLERLTGLERDAQNTKGFLLEDAIVLGRRMTSLENRLTQLERKS